MKTKIKVIIREGIAEAVLAPDASHLDVEIVDCCGDYDDAEQIETYINELYHDPNLKEIDFNVAHFEVEDNDEDEDEDKEE